MIKKIKKMFESEKIINARFYNEKLKVSIITALLIAGAFLILSVVNIIQHSYFMLYLTITGVVLEVIGILIGHYFKKYMVVGLFNVLTTVVLFTYFVVIGGNDGFAVLWIILFPCISIASCDIKLSLFGCLYLLVFLVISFWTPLHTFYLYKYTEIFAIRFPLLYIVSLMLSIYLAIVIKRNEYEIIKNEEQLSYMKDYDQMTGVYNRSKYEQMFDDEFIKYNSIGILFFDINYLKKINDTYGHAAGDRLINAVAKTFVDCSPINHLVFRIGGDEFVVVIPNCEKADCKTFLSACEKCLDEQRKNDPDLMYSVACGISFGDSTDVKKLIAHADKKMYKSKADMHNENE